MSENKKSTESSCPNKQKCEICLEENEFVKLPCNHVFCIQCMQTYYKLLIDENKILKLNCPYENCNFKPSISFLENLLTEEEINKLKELLTRHKLTQDSNNCICPFPDCKSFAVLKKNNSNEKMIICGEGHQICNQCKSLWHKNKNCEFDLEFFKYIEKSEKELKNCPKCGIWTEKTLGCNHMICTSCKKEWCWICSGNYTNDHYSDPNSKCHGKMRQGEVERLNNNNDVNLDFRINIFNNGGQLNINNNHRNYFPDYYRIGYDTIFSFDIDNKDTVIKRILHSFLWYIFICIFNVPVYVGGFKLIHSESLGKGVDIIFFFIPLESCILFFYTIYTYFYGLLFSQIIYGSSLLLYILKIRIRT